MKKVLGLILISLFANPLFAKDFDVSIYVKDIKCLRSSESEGDELYFKVFQFTNEEENIEYNTPFYPTYWASNELNLVKNVKIWRGRITDNEMLKYEVGLMERDLGPDDYIDSLSVTLSNLDNVLATKWDASNPKSRKSLKTRGNEIETIFRGNNSEYLVTLRVEHTPVTKKTVTKTVTTKTVKKQY